LAHTAHRAIIDAMKRIYTAANLPDAHLVHDLLQHAGIPAHIFNGHAMGALGDLPMGSAHPQVWITQLHQEPQARAVIAKYNDKTLTPVPHACRACHESNPGEFELCWNCGAELA
jgi:Putative prokaryotic signal transducing protein